MGDELNTFLQRRWGNAWLDRLGELDLDEFLRATEHFPEAPAERLRRLAIFLEEHAQSGHPGPDWRALRRIYERARDLDPADAWIHGSWGLSASRLAQGADGPARESLFDEAIAAWCNHVRLAPEDPAGAYGMGSTLYPRGSPWTERALPWFRRALALDPTHCMARLYEAHCLHDAHDWPAALAAYERVDQAALERDWPRWRVVKLREQIAWCCLQIGDRARALELFSRMLDAMERASDEAFEEDYEGADDLVAAATGELVARELRERVATCLLARQGEGARREYPRLFHAD